MRVYLDHNATSPLRPEARTAMLAALEAPGNALSVHADGRRARTTIEAARRAVAAAAGANADDVIFTSGGSEANALALRGAVQGAGVAGERITRLIISAIEHDSLRATAALCEETVPGLRILVCPVTASGVADLDELRQMLSEGKGRALVSLMAANNETGVVQPVAEAAKIAHAHGALMHSDAVQAMGKIAVDAKSFDYLSFNAHKFGGPQGVGALVVRQGAPLAPQIRGGGQEFGRRAGTENVAAIAGFAAAVEAAQHSRLNALWRDGLERRLLAAVPHAVVFGFEGERLPNTLCIAAPGVPSENMVIALDLEGFSVSAGAACSSGKVTQSHVLSAMGVETALAARAIRVSFGWNTSEQDLTAFADAWTKIVKRAQARVAA
ncbi:MAG: cysteine desulfurase [Alphaproteobacteria bacterium]|nr:cysteine desulfurase [Alphaproteobacteria bacterium]